MRGSKEFNVKNSLFGVAVEHTGGDVSGYLESIRQGLEKEPVWYGSGTTNVVMSVAA